MLGERGCRRIRGVSALVGMLADMFLLVRSSCYIVFVKR